MKIPPNMPRFQGTPHPNPFRKPEADPLLDQIAIRHPKRRQLAPHQHVANPVFEEGAIPVFEHTDAARPVSLSLKREVDNALGDLPTDKREALIKSRYNVMLTRSLEASNRNVTEGKGRVLADPGTQTLWIAPNPNPPKVDPFLGDAMAPALKKREAANLRKQLSEAITFIAQKG